MSYITAMPVANSILDLAFKTRTPVNPMKLQRLLYLTYCGYLKHTGYQLFTEKFQAWPYGPVIESIYHKFRCFKARPITCYAKTATGEIDVIDIGNSAVLRHIFADIEHVYLPMSAIELSELTRGNNTAWAHAWENNLDTLDINHVKTDPSFQF